VSAAPAAQSPAPPERGRGEALIVAAVALAVRAAAALLSPRVVADVLRYHKLAAHVLDVSWDPYLAPRLYPYPPVWVWAEAGAEWVSRHAGVPFALAMKAPLVAAEAVLAFLLARWGAREGGAARGAGWAYALHPVALLVVGFHGQFDGLALLALALSVRWLDEGHEDRSAIALSAGIGLKSFPILILPFAVLFVRGGAAARLRYVALAVLPVAVILVPFAWADLHALGRELFAYSGVADFGWIGAWRSASALATGRLARGEAERWGPQVAASKAAFVAAAALVFTAVFSGRLRWGIAQSALGVVLAFEVFYGALSAQYLLWPVPLALMRGERLVPVHALVATAALVGFYLFLAPGVLTPADAPLMSAAAAERLWAIGTVALWLTSAAWLADLARRGRRAA